MAMLKINAPSSTGEHRREQ